MGEPISPLIDLIQAACYLVLASAMYSASPTENATVFCHCDAQETHPFAIKNTCPGVERWSSLFSPQSESEYLINLALELTSYFTVPLCMEETVTCNTGVVLSLIHPYVMHWWASSSDMFIYPSIFAFPLLSLHRQSTTMHLHSNVIACDRTHFIRPISLIQWTHDLQFTCIYFYS